MSRKAGLTLIEVLVVLAIIGALAAIAIPQYAVYKTASADAKAKSDLHNMVSAFEAYYTKNNTYFGVDLNSLKSLGFRAERQRERHHRHREPDRLLADRELDGRLG